MELNSKMRNKTIHIGLVKKKKAKPFPVNYNYIYFYASIQIASTLVIPHISWFIRLTIE